MKEEEERRMKKRTERKMNPNGVPVSELNHDSSSHGSHCWCLNLSPVLHPSEAVHETKNRHSIQGAIPVLSATRPKSPEIVTQTHQIEGARWRSRASSDKDHVTHPHHPSLTTARGAEPALSSHLQVSRPSLPPSGTRKSNEAPNSRLSWPIRIVILP